MQRSSGIGSCDRNPHAGHVMVPIGRSGAPDVSELFMASAYFA